MKKCLLTGGTGFIGGALNKLLIEKGIEVTLLVRNSNSVLENFSDKTHIIEYDPFHASDLTLNEEFDCFYNLGWGGS